MKHAMLWNVLAKASATPESIQDGKVRPSLAASECLDFLVLGCAWFANMDDTHHFPGFANMCSARLPDYKSFLLLD